MEKVDVSPVKSLEKSQTYFMSASYEELEDVFTKLIENAIDEGNHILKAVR